ncbi:MAG: hypothetical protein P4L40_14870 [Terracidiphilus sp.]|nr:hypothetical protein [Terracidiphilus sp.]
MTLTVAEALAFMLRDGVTRAVLEGLLASSTRTACIVQMCTLTPHVSEKLPRVPQPSKTVSPFEETMTQSARRVCADKRVARPD